MGSSVPVAEGMRQALAVFLDIIRRGEAIPYNLDTHTCRRVSMRLKAVDEELVGGI